MWGSDSTWAGVLLALCLATSGGARAVPIDLNTFVADPATAVSVTPDGSAATLTEDPSTFDVLLVNDPGFGGPEVIVPRPDVFLSFAYDFVEAPGNDDAFVAFVLDAVTGGSVGPPFEFATQETSAGTVVFDLSGLVGASIGLQFTLVSLEPEFFGTSEVTVSDVRVEGVPEPPALLLLAGGLIVGLLGGVRIRRG